MSSRVVHVAHPAASDDAFALYALADGKIDAEGLRYVYELRDIESLNQRAALGELEVATVSIHAYPYLADRYSLLPLGGSMGDHYGPRLVARTPMTPAQIRRKRIATPGSLTSAYLALNLFEPDFVPVQMPFDVIEDAVARGEVDAGLLIYEAQLTYPERGLHLVVDLGDWWSAQTGLPLPLGGTVVRKDLGEELTRTITRHLRASISYALEHRTEALDYAMRFARGVARATVERFVDMYVNAWSLDYGARGRDAVHLFLRRGVDAGMITRPVPVEFAEG